MKIKHIFAIMLATISIACFAQQDKNSYYYHKNQQIPITINPDKVSMLISTQDDNIISNWENTVSNLGLKFCEAKGLDNWTFRVYEKNNIAPSDKNLIINLKNNAALLSYNPIIIPCYKGNNNKNVVCSAQFNVKLKSENDSILITDAIEQYNLRCAWRDQALPKWYVLEVTPDSPYSPVETANRMYESGLFEYCEPDFDIYKLHFCYDPDVNKQWYIYNKNNESADINLSSAWNYATGKGIKVAVIDELFDYEHPDLKDNFSKEIQNGQYFEGLYQGDHGTMVCGVIGAIRNNNIYGSGVAPDCKLLGISSEMTLCPITFFGNSTSKALTDADIKYNADIVNCSWGVDEDVPENKKFDVYLNISYMEDAINYLVKKGRKGKGTVVCFSAGNDGDSGVPAPQRLVDDVFVVGGSNSNGNYWTTASNGQKVDISAPGENIYVLTPNGGSIIANGTSFSAPTVAGVAALILEINPDFTAREVMDIIEQTAQKLGDKPYVTVEGRPNGTWNQYLGYGVVDAHAAVKLAKQITEQRKTGL